tara:strand:+ start:1285 stop:1452 length:168 start_codon:yes stop_codon:yes gene_type:complete
MKDLSKKIREGGVQKFSGNDLGISRSGKGDFPRFNYQNDKEYKDNYDKIDWGKKK